MTKASPFIKWVGGKSGLIDQLHPLLPKYWEELIYLEPFLGGGAMFFSLNPNQPAHLNDLNGDLITTYQVVRDNPEELITFLNNLQKDHSKEYYYDIRKAYNDEELTELSRAAYFIYLNKTGFNGLYRLNKKGKFNVPVGSYKNPTIYKQEVILKASEALQNVTFYSTDFEYFLKYIAPESFVYFDPPYEPVTQTSNFTSYTDAGFTRDDQERLCKQIEVLTDLGVKCMLSNSASPFIKELYKDFNIHTVKARRSVNCKGNKRGEIEELVITNY